MVFTVRRSSRYSGAVEGHVKPMIVTLHHAKGQVIGFKGNEGLGRSIHSKK